MAEINSATTHTTKDQPADMPGHSTKYDYVIDWIRESVDARRAQNILVERAVLAYQGKPSANRYKRAIKGYVDAVKINDANKAKQIEQACNDIPDKGSMVVHNAVETLVSMAQGGVGQYEFGPYDPDLKKDPKTMDRLACAAKSFYIQNRVDSIVPQYIRMAVLSGVGTIHMKQRNKKKVLTLLETQQMLTDPKRFKTNFQRFIGHSQRESFAAVKARIKNTKGGGYVLKTINEADVYLTQIALEMNSTLQTNVVEGALHDQIRRDVDTFYQPIITRIKERRSMENGNPNEMYEGDEVEMTYLYDQQNDIYFEIVNRRYIVVAKSNPLSRDIKCDYYDDKGDIKTKTKTIKLDDPYIELLFIKTFWDTYGLSPLFYVLDDFDDLCAMESVLYHNLSIMAPLTFVGQSSDAEKVSRIASVAGEIVEALPQTFGVLDKKHDITPVVTAIQRIEEKIKRTMKAVDPFELQGMIGDRATAKEVVSASGQVSQGINPFLANIESAFSVMGDKFIKMELIFGEGTYSFAHNGKYAELSQEEMAGDYEIVAKLITSIKLEQEANSRKALELIQYLNGNEALDQKAFLGATVPIVLGGLLSRQVVEDMVKPAYKQMPEEVIAAIKRRAEENAAKHPIDKLDLPTDPATLDQLIAQMGGHNAETMYPTAPLPADPNAPVPPPGGGDAMNQPTIPVDAQGNPVPQPQPALQPAPQIDPNDPSVLAALAGGAPANGPPASADQAGVVANDQAGLGYGG